MQPLIARTQAWHPCAWSGGPGGAGVRQRRLGGEGSRRPRGDFDSPCEPNRPHVLDCRLELAMRGRVHPVDATRLVVLSEIGGRVGRPEGWYRWVRPDARERIAARLAAGGSTRELALEFGCSTRTVLRIGEQA